MNYNEKYSQSVITAVRGLSTRILCVILHNHVIASDQYLPTFFIIVDEELKARLGHVYLSYIDCVVNDFDLNHWLENNIDD